MLFSPSPADNLLPRDGILNDFGVVLEYSNRLYQQLLTTLPWQADKVIVYGKTHVTKRQVVWMGHKEVTYRYSGHRHITIDWSPDIIPLKEMIEQNLLKIGVVAHFNTCLLNYYPTGSDGMGYHADDEPELGEMPIIAALSLGAARKFTVKHNATKEVLSIWLQSGQLIVMRGEMQTRWQHSITKSTTINEGRISLTFREVFP